MPPPGPIQMPGHVLGRRQSPPPLSDGSDTRPPPSTGQPTPIKTTPLDDGNGSADRDSYQNEASSGAQPPPPPPSPTPHGDHQTTKSINVPSVIFPPSTASSHSAQPPPTQPSLLTTPPPNGGGSGGSGITDGAGHGDGRNAADGQPGPPGAATQTASSTNDKVGNLAAVGGGRGGSGGGGADVPPITSPWSPLPSPNATEKHASATIDVAHPPPGEVALWGPSHGGSGTTPARTGARPPTATTTRDERPGQIVGSFVGGALFLFLLTGVGVVWRRAHRRRKRREEAEKKWVKEVLLFEPSSSPRPCPESHQRGGAATHNGATRRWVDKVRRRSVGTNANDYGRHDDAEKGVIVTTSTTLGTTGVLLPSYAVETIPSHSYAATLASRSSFDPEATPRRAAAPGARPSTAPTPASHPLALASTPPPCLRGSNARWRDVPATPPPSWSSRSLRSRSLVLGESNDELDTVYGGSVGVCGGSSSSNDHTLCGAASVKSKKTTRTTTSGSSCSAASQPLAAPKTMPRALHRPSSSSRVSRPASQLSQRTTPVELTAPPRPTSAATNRTVQATGAPRASPSPTSSHRPDEVDCAAPRPGDAGNVSHTPAGPLHHVAPDATRPAAPSSHLLEPLWRPRDADRGGDPPQGPQTTQDEQRPQSDPSCDSGRLRPSTVSHHSHWSLSKSLNEAEEAAMWLPEASTASKVPPAQGVDGASRSHDAVASGGSDHHTPVGSSMAGSAAASKEPGGAGAYLYGPCDSNGVAYASSQAVRGYDGHAGQVQQEEKQCPAQQVHASQPLPHHDNCQVDVRYSDVDLDDAGLVHLAHNLPSSHPYMLPPHREEMDRTTVEHRSCRGSPSFCDAASVPTASGIQLNANEVLLNDDDFDWYPDASASDPHGRPSAVASNEVAGGGGGGGEGGRCFDHVQTTTTTMITSTTTSYTHPRFHPGHPFALRRPPTALSRVSEESSQRLSSVRASSVYSPTPPSVTSGVGGGGGLGDASTRTPAGATSSHGALAGGAGWSASSHRPNSTSSFDSFATPSSPAP